MKSLLKWGLVLFGGYSLVGCNLVCQDKVASESTSPDQVLTVTAFVRDCGATTEFSTIATLHKQGAGFRDNEDIVFVAKGVHKLQVAWTAQRAVKVQCTDCQRNQIFKEVTKVADIDISY